MTKSKTPWPCDGCGALLSGKGGKRYCGLSCRPRCSIEVCGKPRHGSVYCSAHHSRWKKYGDPLAPMVRSKNEGSCVADGCDNPMRKVGLCATHYSQTRRGLNQPREIKRPWRADVGGDCRVCGTPVPNRTRKRYCSDGCQQAWVRTQGQRPKTSVCDFCHQSFSLGRERTGRLQRSDTKWCPDCGRDSPDVMRFRKYGVTRDQYLAALATGCAICEQIKDVLHVDHDHNCCPGDRRCCGECVRGFICGPCNRGLGLFFDSPAALNRAAQYLSKSRS